MMSSLKNKFKQKFISKMPTRRNQRDVLSQEINDTPSPNQSPACDSESIPITFPKKNKKTKMHYVFTMWPKLVQGKVPTREFLHCCNLVVKFIDTLGIAFLPVSRDVSNNTKTVMTRFLQDCERFTYIEDLLDCDISENTLSNAEALLWLKRGLNFLCHFLQSFVRDYEAGVKTESIAANLRSSYELSLQMYHNVFLRQLFNVLCAASPSRTQLVERLSVIVEEKDTEMFMSQLKHFYEGLRTNLDALFAFYVARNLFQPS